MEKEPKYRSYPEKFALPAPPLKPENKTSTEKISVTVLLEYYQ